MGAKVTRTDFEWVYTEEPHATRRKLILEKYPQIKKLFGHDPNFKWMVTALVVIQVLSLPYVAQLSWPMMMVAAYCFGGVINHSLMLAMHEIGHNMALGHARPTANRWFGIFANLPMGIPASISFRKYHKEHHKFLAQDGLDPDLPTLLEAKLFSTTLGKVTWVALMPMLYIFRPLVVRPLPTELMEVANAVVQLFFNAVIVQLYGWKVLAYLIGGSLMSIGLHPMSAHLITEHYMFEKGFETYSYYGPMNYLMFNGGYHVEHHDFPAVPYTRLPEVRRIAAEFYDNLPYHKSWLSVFYYFIMDPAIGPYARIKRNQYGLKS